MAQQKTQKWEKVVGKSFEEAEKAIKEINPDLEVIKLLDGTPVNRDFCTTRVRVFVNAAGKVVLEPSIG